eukprot:TRINITY_DN14038_c0_g1_i1.p1 TRINITY_DN14038_c0_g1~~TRINITY_DN14038_c0_g1_i1.p1  ORF type:complete len:419 (-),score=83.91 TRINITY_DN14038_c0_g1_i1:24-1280(-)
MDQKKKRFGDNLNKTLDLLNDPLSHFPTEQERRQWNIDIMKLLQIIKEVLQAAKEMVDEAPKEAEEWVNEVVHASDDLQAATLALVDLVQNKSVDEGERQYPSSRAAVLSNVKKVQDLLAEGYAMPNRPQNQRSDMLPKDNLRDLMQNDITRVDHAKDGIGLDTTAMGNNPLAWDLSGLAAIIRKIIADANDASQDCSQEKIDAITEALDRFTRAAKEVIRVGKANDLRAAPQAKENVLRAYRNLYNVMNADDPVYRQQQAAKWKPDPRAEAGKDRIRQIYVKLGRRTLDPVNNPKPVREYVTLIINRICDAVPVIRNTQGLRNLDYDSFAQIWDDVVDQTRAAAWVISKDRPNTATNLVSLVGGNIRGIIDLYDALDNWRRHSFDQNSTKAMQDARTRFTDDIRSLNAGLEKIESQY